MIVSGGIHLLLAMMLIFGPGFLASSSDKATRPIDFIPAILVDSALAGGGDRDAKNSPPEGVIPPAPTPPTPTPPAAVITPPAPVVPTPAERVQPRPPEREMPPVPKDAPHVNTPTIEPTPVKPTPRKPRDIDVDTTVVRSTSADTKAKLDAQRKADKLADQRRIANINSVFKNVTTGIRGGISGSTEIKLKGPGGGGLPYGNFLSAVQKIYEDAWTPPAGAPSSTVSVTITIARDGTILSAHITDGSGNGSLDSSVQKALDRVRAVPALPEGETRESRTVTIGFNPENK